MKQIVITVVLLAVLAALVVWIVKAMLYPSSSTEFLAALGVLSAFLAGGASAAWFMWKNR